MKRMYAMVLLSIFALDVTAVFFVFKIQQFQIKKEIKRQIKRGVPEDELFKITVTAENRHLLDWQKAHEFRYEGTMYDVVREEHPDNAVTVYFCISDRQETVLFAHLDELLKKKTDPLKRTGKTFQAFLKLFSNLYFHPLKPAFILDRSRISQPSRAYHNHYVSPVLAVHSPPPWAPFRHIPYQNPILPFSGDRSHGL